MEIFMYKLIMLKSEYGEAVTSRFAENFFESFDEEYV